MFKVSLLVLSFVYALSANVLNVRLADVSDRILEGINITTDDSITVKSQKLVPGGWQDTVISWPIFNADWTAVTDTAVLHNLNAPIGQALTWTINPTKAFTGVVKVHIENMYKMIPINITEAPPSNVVIKPLTSLDSIYVGKPIKLLAYLENKDGVRPDTWSGIVSIQEVTEQANLNMITFNGLSGIKGIVSPVTFNGKVQDTLVTVLYTAGLYKYRVKVMDQLMTETLYDSIHTFTVQSIATFIQPILSRQGTLDCLQPFSGQILTLNGKTVARFSNVKAYNLTTQRIPKGTYILKASTGFGSQMQRVITLFQ